MNPVLNDPNAEGWHGLEPAAKSLMFWFGLWPFLIPIIPATVLPLTLMPGSWGWAVTLPVGAACLGIGAVYGRNRWRYVRWRLDDTGFRLRRGRWWQKEIFVPRTRVQHLDIHNGPMERSRGLATLVIHTAGTESHAVKQQGFSLETATALRDALIPESRRDDSAL